MGKSITELSSVTRVGLDLAKNAFQVHGVDAKGEVVVTRKLRRGALAEFFAKLAPCVVAMEACSSAHHWGRQLLGLGFEVKLIPPAHVKPGACPRARPGGSAQQERRGRCGGDLRGGHSGTYETHQRPPAVSGGGGERGTTIVRRIADGSRTAPYYR